MYVLSIRLWSYKREENKTIMCPVKFEILLIIRHTFILYDIEKKELPILHLMDSRKKRLEMTNCENLRNLRIEMH